MQAKLKWSKGMQFESTNRDITTQMDATADHGGEGKHPTPKELVLNAMMGCTAMDTMSLLQKMRIEVNSMTMDIEAQKNDEYPIHFIKALMRFHIQGSGNSEKVIKAVEKSLTKYCGVNYMISKTCEIKYEIHFNDQLINTGFANFDD